MYIPAHANFPQSFPERIKFKYWPKEVNVDYTGSNGHYLVWSKGDMKFLNHEYEDNFNEWNYQFLPTDIHSKVDSYLSRTELRKSLCWINAHVIRATYIIDGEEKAFYISTTEFYEWLNSDSYESCEECEQEPPNEEDREETFQSEAQLQLIREYHKEKCPMCGQYIVFDMSISKEFDADPSAENSSLQNRAYITMVNNHLCTAPNQQAAGPPTDTSDRKE